MGPNDSMGIRTRREWKSIIDLIKARKILQMYYMHNKTLIIEKK